MQVSEELLSQIRTAFIQYWTFRYMIDNKTPKGAPVAKIHKYARVAWARRLKEWKNKGLEII